MQYIHKPMRFMKDEVRYAVFKPLPNKRVFIVCEHKQQLQVGKIEKGNGVLT